MLIDGDGDSEGVLRSMLISDNMNVNYPMDFQKFLSTLTGGGPIGPGVSAVGSAGGTPAAYY